MAIVLNPSVNQRTALDLINGALRLLQVKSSDTTLTSDEANDALDSLNQMMDSWSNENLMIYQITREEFPLISGHNPHTIGYAADFDTTRPTRIMWAAVKATNAQLFPVQIVDYKTYDSVKLQSLSNAYPYYLYYDFGYSTGNIYLYPIPTNFTLLIDSYKPIELFNSLTQLVLFPPGYFRALRYNLARELAAEYQLQAGPEIEKIALESRMNLKRANHKPVPMNIDPAILGQTGLRYNIYLDGM